MANLYYNDGNGNMVQLANINSPSLTGNPIVPTPSGKKTTQLVNVGYLKSYISDKIKKTTAKIYRELGFEGVIRIDYFVKDKIVYVNEINTVPGSLAYYLFCKNTIEFRKMLSEMLEFSMNSFNKNQSIKKTYNSGIISSLKAKGSKKA